MNFRSNTRKARRDILLASAVLVAIPASAAFAADQAPVLKAPPPADVVGWYYFGDVEVGARAFIQRPTTGFGRAPPPDNWLTPSTSESSAKFQEYGQISPGLFLDHLYVGAGSKDGLYLVDLWAQNVGYNNQSYLFNFSKAGEHYLAIGWDQIPHQLSNSAKTVFGGGGTTNLTVDPTLRANLQANSRNATATGPAGVTARTNIEGFVNGAETGVGLSTQRNTGTVDYRYTPDSQWEFKVDYSNEHRTGTRPLAMNFGYAFGAAPGFATSFVEAIQPIDDRTQNVNATAQYVGTSLWGQRWVSNFRYSGSFFDNSLKSFDAQNPFCLTCLIGNGPGDRGPNLLRMSLQPSNVANALTWSNVFDLPGRSRYTSTVQYNIMRQDDPFVNTATNGLTPAPLPALSANAKVNTLLANNTLTTQLTDDLKSTLRYRYYDVDNRTPEMVFANYVFSDSSISASPRRNLAIAYTKQNASEELTWRATKWLNLGASFGWEQYDRTRRDVNVTNEESGKLFMTANLWEAATARASVTYSQRRYDQYDAAAFVDSIGLLSSSEVSAMRKYDISNRDRLKAEGFLDVPVGTDLTLTPTVGLRNDIYPADVVNQLGLSLDKGWNAGIDVSARLGPDFKASFGYNYEVRDRQMADCCGGAPGGVIPANIWSSDIKQHYHTVTASADWKAIPSKLEFRLEYLLALGSEANDTTPCASGNVGCTGGGTGVTTTQFPTERNTFQRLSAIANYYVDPDVVRQMGWTGAVVARLRYTYERNHTENWAIDNLTPYIPTADQTVDLTGGGRSIFLAAFNPNYTAQIIAASVAFKW